MEVKIGVQYAARELSIDTNETQESLEKLVSDAVSAGSVLSLTDTKGRRVIVPADKITYVEIGSSVVGQVGFRG